MDNNDNDISSSVLLQDCVVFNYYSFVSLCYGFSCDEIIHSNNQLQNHYNFNNQIRLIHSFNLLGITCFADKITPCNMFELDTLLINQL